MGQDGGDAVEVEGGDGLAEDVEGTRAVGGHLEEDVASGGVVGEPGAGAVEEDEVVEERHLHGGAKTEGNGVFVEKGLEAGGGGGDDGGVGGAQAVGVVGGGDHEGDAVGHGLARHVEGGGVVGGAIVEGGEDVGVEVDHGERLFNAEAQRRGGKRSEK